MKWNRRRCILYTILWRSSTIFFQGSNSLHPIQHLSSVDLRQTQLNRSKFIYFPSCISFTYVETWNQFSLINFWFPKGKNLKSTMYNGLELICYYLNYQRKLRPEERATTITIQIDHSLLTFIPCIFSSTAISLVSRSALTPSKSERKFIT